MVREIKFRAKYFDEWHFGIIVTRKVKDKGRMRNIYILMGLDNENWIPLREDQYDTIGQFTGLHDKNGREIYEGDIMGLPEQDANGVKYKNRYVRVVEWVNDGFFLLDHCMMGGEVRKYGDRLALEISLKSEYAGIASCFEERGLDYTVIGNIYDNPELLKGE